MIKCVIIDDEPLAIEVIQSYLGRMADFELMASFTNPVDALAYVHRNKIDLVFLDIEMPLFNGLEFAKTLSYNPAIIITTAYRDYAVESFELEAVDYLLKPIAFHRFIKAITKVTNKIAGTSAIHEDMFPGNVTGENEDLWVKVDKRLIRIAISEIFYIESLKDYIRIKTSYSEFITYHTLNGIMEKLPATKFFRIHKSYIAAIQRIDAIEGNMIMIAGKTLPIGRSYREELIEKTQTKL
ncbi:MAG: DNA-binding response regulator [Mucilaginibacter sp.]|nr:DNA-binding response regulator [Mucilaginibacter sp.]